MAFDRQPEKLDPDHLPTPPIKTKKQNANRLNTSRAQAAGIAWLILGSAVFLLIGISLERTSPVSMRDFKIVYLGTRCLIQNLDPYRESDELRIYQAEKGEIPTEPNNGLRFLTVFIYLPSVFTFTTPFALLAWGPAHVLWILLTAACFISAASLMWQACIRCSPALLGGLICFFLATSELLLEVGNAAGIAVSLCVIAVWCFFQNRFVTAATICMAFSLIIKPHDAGMVWLYFLLAGGTHRKRALYTLGVTVILCLPSVLWVSHVAPSWTQEMHSNLVATTAHGGMSDPGPDGLRPASHGAQLVSLQTVLSVFWDNPRFYNPASYSVCGVLLAVWFVVTLRSRPSPSTTWLALAAIAALSMLPTYHRQQDTRILLLTIPACAMLWSEGGAIGLLALLMNIAGIIFTGDIPLQLLAILADKLGASSASLSGKVLMVLLARPAPLILLIMGIFYLWVYVCRSRPKSHERLSGSVGDCELPDG
jgi:hypothetical protein